MENKELGKIPLSEGDSLVVSDPCYALGSNQAVIADAAHGNWIITSEVDQGIVSSINAVVRDPATGRTIRPQYADWEKCADLGVDSGLMSIGSLQTWKLSPAPNEGERYHSICNVACKAHYGVLIDDSLAIVSSGYGDGNYSCFIAKNKDGKIIGVRVEFYTSSNWYDDDVLCW